MMPAHAALRVGLLIACVVFRAQGFPQLAGEGGVVLLGAGMGQGQSPDASQQDEGMQASANSMQSAGAAEAAADSDPANGDTAKAAGSQAIVAKAQAGGADPESVAAQASSTADPATEAAESPEADEKNVMARSQSMTRAQEVDDEAAEAQRRTERAALVDSAPGMKAAVESGTEPDAVPPLNPEESAAAKRSEAHGQYIARASNPAAPGRPKADKGVAGFHELAKMTVPLDGATVLNKLFGSLTECQEACKQATLCNGVEYSPANGGICLLLKRGIQWSSTFTYYDKDGSQDPVLVTKNDKKLMWGKISERSHDLGGLAMNDVPGATVYKPPTKEETKEQEARTAIRQMDRPVSEERRKAAIDASAKLKKAETLQAHAQNVVGETREIAKAVKAKQQRVERYNNRAQMHAAKINMAAEEMSAHAQFLRGDYERTISQAKQYAKAAKAFSDAGNPMAGVMEHKAKKWLEDAAKLKRKSASAMAKSAVQKMHAKIAVGDSDHWQKQALWANQDEKAATSQLEMADTLEHSADKSLASHKDKAKEAKYKLNCNPICGFDYTSTDPSVPVQTVADQTQIKTRPGIYTPNPVRDEPSLSKTQFEYTRRGAWDYAGKPVKRGRLPHDLPRAFSEPPEVLQDIASAPGTA